MRERENLTDGKFNVNDTHAATPAAFSANKRQFTLFNAYMCVKYNEYHLTVAALAPFEIYEEDYWPSGHGKNWNRSIIIINKNNVRIEWPIKKIKSIFNFSAKRWKLLNLFVYFHVVYERIRIHSARYLWRKLNRHIPNRFTILILDRFIRFRHRKSCQSWWSASNRWRHKCFRLAVFMSRPKKW